MARLSGHLESRKSHQQNGVRTNIRTYPTNARLSSRESIAIVKDKPLRAVGNYGSTSSLHSLADQRSTHTTTSLRTIDFSTGSLVDLLEGTDFPGTRRRSPSLPPIYTKDNQQQSRLSQESTRELGVEGLRYSNQERPQKQHHRQAGRNPNGIDHPYEEREGETSGYGSDSAEAPLPPASLAHGKRIESEMSERTWQNPYCETPETSLPGSGRQSVTKLGELNRQRWGSIWGGESSGKSDRPAPSWLERSLSRLDHSSQILVINHESASSPDSSTTGSTGSDSKTYIRGQNIPVDAQVLQEREAKRLRARELQNAIKQQLEEKERQRKAEREKRLKEEREEEERIKRDRDKEKERLQEEQRRLREKECAKIKKAAAMREVMEIAERRAREEKRQRRQKDESRESPKKACPESNCWESPKAARAPEDPCDLSREDFRKEKASKVVRSDDENDEGAKGAMVENGSPRRSEESASEDLGKSVNVEASSTNVDCDENTLRLPVGKEVAIVLSGRLDDAEFFNRANLQLVNLVVTSPRKNEQTSSSALNEGLNALIKSLANPVVLRKSPRSGLSPRISENRILTPSKYRNFINHGRDFGTQTDGESEPPDNKDASVKDRKDVVNNNRRDVEKSTNTGAVEETGMKALVRSKVQTRTSIDTRPRWNANRPGTRYRTQSEKDPHYQRRMRMRRRRVESSDERSRSPSPDRRKSTNHKSGNRNFNRRKVKLDSYDADLSMDSLNSVLPLRIDEHGRVNILAGDSVKRRSGETRGENDKEENNEKLDVWCGQEILSQLASLRNGLLTKQREWNSQRCLMSPSEDFY
ncbi:myb-like protein X isoform X2 [Venturia canescens]|nr:myb-like protein X isoform X2 [Venturia canescens]